MNIRKTGRAIALLGALAGMLVLSGCAGMRVSSMDTLLKREPPCNCIDDGKLYRRNGDDVTMDLEGFLDDAGKKGKTAAVVLDEFLNCTVADHGKNPDENLKVYRGYVALAVLSRYAAFNYTGYIGGSADLSFQTYNGIQDDAMSALSRIDFADKALRLGSGIETIKKQVSTSDLENNPTLAYLKQIAPTEANTLGRLHDVEKLHRALAVMMVAASAEKPTVARAKNWFTNIVAALGGTLSNPGSLVDQGIKVLGKSLTLDTYGNAYLDDARCELESMAAANCKKPGETLGQPAAAADKSKVPKCLTPCSTCPSRNASCKPVPRDGTKQTTPRPSETDWNYWANIIKSSCTAIAAATGATSHCLGVPPTTAAVASGANATGKVE